MAELEGAPLASFLSRAVAFFIDMAIASMSFVVPAVLGAMIFVKMGWIGHNVHITFDPFHHEHWESVIWFVVFIAASNYIGNGATIGKKAMGIRAVSLVHHRLSLWHSVERALGYGASALEAFFGFFQYFLDPNRQTVHDRIAKTIVVSERKRKVAALSESARAEQKTNEPQGEAAAPEAAEDRVAPA
ncbi:MAG TPA: RDD family protein [Acidobacteriaceae bacterium]|nr:RDD family protein [Acidobacteriaceae bacterium]